MPHLFYLRLSVGGWHSLLFASRVLYCSVAALLFASQRRRLAQPSICVWYTLFKCRSASICASASAGGASSICVSYIIFSAALFLFASLRRRVAPLLFASLIFSLVSPLLCLRLSVCDWRSLLFASASSCRTSFICVSASAVGTAFYLRRVYSIVVSQRFYLRLSVGGWRSLLFASRMLYLVSHLFYLRLSVGD